MRQYTTLYNFILFYTTLSYFIQLYHVLYNFIELYSILQNFIELYSIVFYRTLQNFIEFYRTLQNFIVFYRTLQNFIELYRTLYNFIQFYTTLCPIAPIVYHLKVHLWEHQRAGASHLSWHSAENDVLLRLGSSCTPGFSGRGSGPPGKPSLSRSLAFKVRALQGQSATLKPRGAPTASAFKARAPT